MKITVKMLTKVLRRNANSLVDTPEGNLILAVIASAITDADHRHVEARRFFSDGRLESIAPLIGLDPDFVCETVGRVRDWIPAKP